MTRRELTETIKERAKELGFQKIGVARAERLDEEAARLHQWLARGYHASMGWMERNEEKRIDPRNVLPGAQSVVSLAMNYYTPYAQSGEEGAGKVSRYAWGDDYHLVLPKRLESLLAYIQQCAPAAEGKVYVDTGPVMDKAWAQRAGIGWIGKHTNVITQEFGSWVFLGEILLTIELEYDVPATDHCGSCTLCIEACPTDAIVEPYVVDAHRCISYLTIEHRGEIPGELAEHFEGWLYGCDICQDVCPWNEKFSVASALQEFQPRPQTRAPRIAAWACMTEEEFRTMFSKSAIKRAKHAGLTRNAAVLLASHTKS